MTKDEFLSNINKHKSFSGLTQSFHDFVSYTERSIPNLGSPTKSIHNLNYETIMTNLKSVTHHNSGDMTVKTKFGNIRFWILIRQT